MYRALTALEARAVEERAVAEQGVTLSTLMRAAGAAIAREAAARVPSGDFVVLAGPGNNGGDGWVAALELAAGGRRVRVVSLVRPDELGGIAGEVAREAVAAQVAWSVPSGPLERDAFLGASGVIDALLGIGAHGELREPLGSWVDAANASGAYVIAVDVPTGVDSDTGAVASAAVAADCTVTFTAPKRGLVTYPGAGHAGEVVVADIGILPEIANMPGAPEIWTPAEYAALLPLPALDAHKDSRGRVLVIAGSSTYPGAAVLAARGAMRAGAGYVTLAVPTPVVPTAHAHLLAAPVVGLPAGKTGAFSSVAAKQLVHMSREYDAVVLGPGLTLADGAVATARSIVAETDVPLVIDADGLNALVDAQGLLSGRSAPTMLTPHPGELGRLLGSNGAAVQADRLRAASALACDGCAVVLKGAGTVISAGGRHVINTSGTPALATAGTGDVLAGVIGALLAQRLSPLEAGALGAYVHGRAGEAAAAQLTPVCVTAEDVPEFLPAAIAELLGVW